MMVLVSNKVPRTNRGIPQSLVTFVMSTATVKTQTHTHILYSVHSGFKINAPLLHTIYNTLVHGILTGRRCFIALALVEA